MYSQDMWSRTNTVCVHGRGRIRKIWTRGQQRRKVSLSWVGTKRNPHLRFRGGDNWFKRSLIGRPTGRCSEGLVWVFFAFGTLRPVSNFNVQPPRKVTGFMSDFSPRPHLNMPCMPWMNFAPFLYSWEYETKYCLLTDWGPETRQTALWRRVLWISRVSVHRWRVW